MMIFRKELIENVKSHSDEPVVINKPKVIKMSKSPKTSIVLTSRKSPLPTRSPLT